MTLEFQRELITDDIWRNINESAETIKEKLGGGRNTATALAHVIYWHGREALVAGADPIGLKQGIEKAVEAVDAALARMSRPMDSEMIARVGAIWADNDEEIGRVIAGAIDKVGKTGTIIVERGPARGASLEVGPGMAFAGGCISPYFMTDPDRQEAVLDNPYVLILPDTVRSIAPLLGLLSQVADAKRPLLLVAVAVEGEALATLVVNKLRGTMQVAAVKLPSAAGRDATLRKIVALTGGGLVDGSSENVERLTLANLGRVSKVVADRFKTVIVGNPQPERRGDFEKVALIRVGGNTNDEARKRQELASNAVKVTRAALDEGIVPGGGVALIRAAKALKGLRLGGDAQKGVNIVARAIEEPLRLIGTDVGIDGVVERVKGFRTAERGFNVLTNRYENLMVAGVVDPVKVVRSALNESAGVASRLSPELANQDVEETPTLGDRLASAWLAGTTPPLKEGVTVSVGFRIGAAVPGALVSEPFAEPEAPGELWVMLWARDAVVEPDGYWLRLPPSGNTRSVFFVVTPQREGELEMRFRIYPKGESSLLQELAVSVPVIKQQVEQTR